MNKEKLDNAIQESIKTLGRSERGRSVGNLLHELLTGPATGLDSSGMDALAILVLAFAKEGRREFAAQLQFVYAG
jgi:hypothetical protein